MVKVNSLLKAMAALVFGCLPGLAVTTYNFDFTTSTSGQYSSLSAFSSTLGVTATAFYTLNANTALASATVSASSGLGICNPATESGNNCKSPQDQIDNDGRYEFMLFKFSTPVSLSTIVLKNVAPLSGVDRDMTYYTSSSSASSITLGSLSNLGNSFSAPTTVACASGCTGSTTTDSLSGTGVTWMLVGAAGPGMADNNKDAFRIQSLTVATNDLALTSQITTTPEPGTWFLGLTALVLISALNRK